MAPEIFLNKPKAITTAIDVWALGVILFCMLYGCLPFEGKLKNEIIMAIKNKFIRYPDIARELHISKEANDLIDKIFTIDYKERIKVN